ncbi:Anther-specific proline-rich protein APG [Paramyrothecium foliicola]|nr:Anther-specific proline-rich protein APG [Paramyrothecium foliicola]
MWPQYLTTQYNQSSIRLYNLAAGGAVVDVDLITSGSHDVDYQVHGKFEPYSSRQPCFFPAKTTLWSIFIGINDIYRYLVVEGKDSSTAVAVIARLRELVNDLYGYGARQFLFVSTPPQSLFPNNANKTFAPDLEAAAINWNKMLAQLAQEVDDDFPDSTVFYFDIAPLIRAVTEDPSQFPETAVYKSTGWCAAYRSGTSTPDFKADSCDYNALEYMYIDGSHPTQGFHQILAKQISEKLAADRAQVISRPLDLAVAFKFVPFMRACVGHGLDSVFTQQVRTCTMTLDVNAQGLVHVVNTEEDVHVPTKIEANYNWTQLQAGLHWSLAGVAPPIMSLNDAASKDPNTPVTNLIINVKQICPKRQKQTITICTDHTVLSERETSSHILMESKNNPQKYLLGGPLTGVHMRYAEPDADNWKKILPFVTIPPGDEGLTVTKSISWKHLRQYRGKSLPPDKEPRPGDAYEVRFSEARRETFIGWWNWGGLEGDLKLRKLINLVDSKLNGVEDPAPPSPPILLPYGAWDGECDNAGNDSVRLLNILDITSLSVRFID